MSDQSGSTGMQPKFYFLMRRLHSLSGILPVGVFVIMHLFTNFQLIMGPDDDPGAAFQHEVDFIHSLPALTIIEYTLWLSIGFHAVLGFYYTFKGNKSNVGNYPHKANYRYTLQRITGMIALVFIFLHVATLRWRWEFGGWFTPFYAEGVDGEPIAAATTARALQYSWWVVLLYFIGSASIVYHWCNGLWTAAITWGITITTSAQKRWGQMCAGLAALLSVFFLGAIIGALNYDVTEADQKAIEQKIESVQQGGAPEVNSTGVGLPDADNAERSN